MLGTQPLQVRSVRQCVRHQDFENERASRAGAVLDGNVQVTGGGHWSEFSSTFVFETIADVDIFDPVHFIPNIKQHSHSTSILLLPDS